MLVPPLSKEGVVKGFSSQSSVWHTYQMSSTKRIQRKQRAATGGGQLTMGHWAEESQREEKPSTGEGLGVVFKDPDPNTLFVGEQRLDVFLREMGFASIFELRALVRSLDLSLFTAKYKGGGRQPYHPAGIIGLILLGIIDGKNSLRELETLGRSDVRSWWLTGGVMPNYSVICRFINKNAQELTEDFFEQLTRQIMKRTSSTGASVAIDGTVIQAAASRYKTIKQEAAKQAAEKARKKAQKDPDNEGLAERAAQAEKTAEVAQERSKSRAKKGKNAQASVCPTELDAVVQQLKNKAFAPGYKASVAANDDRIITANAVHPSSETAVVPKLIEQTERVTEERVTEVLEDAGYHCAAVLNHALEHDINILCPQGSADGADKNWEKTSDKMFLKNQFRFDEANDVYICPAGQHLERDHVYKGNAQNPAYVSYRSAACGSCALHDRCTKAANRAIKRYTEDELKEAMREVMKQPGARERYGQRQAMVEPVYSEIKGVQNLNRFHRRDLDKVSLEYSLHCSAHNVRRYLRLRRRSALAIVREALSLAPGWHIYALFRAKFLEISIKWFRQFLPRHLPGLLPNAAWSV